ncbi:MAG: hypothetical protein ACUZ8E_17000 [Candidatus Anammoxibacter sp.]
MKKCKYTILTFILFIGFGLTNLVLAEENNDAEFTKHLDTYVKDFQDKIDCIKKAQNWNDVAKCHEKAERNEKVRRLKELEEEQERLREELSK